MALEGLKLHMESIGFATSRPQAEMTEAEVLREYDAYLGEQLKIALSDVGFNYEAGRNIVRTLSRSDLFRFMDSPAIKAAGSGERIPVAEMTALVRGPYVNWLLKQREELNRYLDTTAAKRATGSEQTAEMKKAVTELQSGQMSKALEAGMDYQKAKTAKTANKEDVKKFLKDSYPGIASRIGHTVTADAIEAVQRKTAEIENEIKRQKVDHPSWTMSAFQQEAFDKKIAELDAQLKEGERLIRELGAKRDEKVRTLAESDRLEAGATQAFQEFDAGFRAQNEKFVEGIQDMVKVIRAEEETIRKKKAEWDALRNEIDSIALKAARERSTMHDNYAALERRRGRLRALRADLKMPARQREEAVQKEWDALQKDEYTVDRDAEVRRESIRENEDKHRALHPKLPLLATELSLINVRYNVLRDCVDKIGREQEEVVGLRNELRQELEWLKKLKKVEGALNLYCAFSKFSFPLLVNIGKLVAGENCGPLGAFLVTGLSGASALQGVASSPWKLKDLLMTTVSEGVGVVLNTASMTKIHPYDTGSFAVNLVIGLSGGKSLGGDMQGATAKVGLALNYSAGFSQADDRRFRTVFTLTIEGNFELEVPELLKAEIAGELYTETTGMIFQDVYHWAGWLAQKWANIAALLRGAKFFDLTDKWHIPDEMRKQHMIEMAGITMANDPQLYEIFERTMKYVSMPLTAMTCTDYAGGMTVSASVADTIGAGFSLMRHKDPVFYKRESSKALSIDGHHGTVLCKHGKQISESVSVMAGTTATYTYSNVEKDSVVDNQGKSYIFTISPGGLKQQTGVQAIEEPSKDVAHWIEKMEDGLENVQTFAANLPIGILNAVKESTSLKFITQIAGAVGSDGVQFNFYRSDLGPLAEGRNKVVLLYFRPVFTAGLQVSGEIELGVPGLNADVGIGASLSRTFCETLGINTLVYVQMVFNGLMNISDLDCKDDPRPEEAQGKVLWWRWAEQHGNSLYRIMTRIAEDKKDEAWVTREVMASGGHKLISYLRQNVKLFQQKKPFLSRVRNFKYVPAELKPLQDFLYDRWKSATDPDWHSSGTPKFQFTLNPFVLIPRISRTRSQAYKLDSSLRALGPRRGLRELYAQETEAQVKATRKDNWVPDDKVVECTACHKRFSLTVRKHHCRRCGKIFCSNCARFNMEVPGYEGTQKVCEKCYAALVDAAARKAERAGHHDGHGPDSSADKGRHGTGDEGSGARNIRPVKSEAVLSPRAGSLFTLKGDPTRLSGLKAGVEGSEVVHSPGAGGLFTMAKGPSAPSKGPSLLDKVPGKIPESKAAADEGSKAPALGLQGKGADAAASKTSDLGSEGKGSAGVDAKEPAERVRLVDSAGISPQLIVYNTAGGGDCGIHAFMGAASASMGPAEYTYRGDMHEIRGSIAERITGGAPHIATKYNALIAGLLSELKALGRGGLVTADSTRLWDAFSHVTNMQDDAAAFSQIREARNAVMVQLRDRIRGNRPEYDSLRDLLIDDILASNNPDDGELQNTLRGAPSLEQRRQRLRARPSNQIDNLLSANFDLAMGYAQSIDTEGQVTGAIRRYSTLMAGQPDLTALVQGSSAQFRAAYASALLQQGYFLLKEDVETLADIRGKCLIIYNEHRQLNMDTRYAKLPAYNAGAGEPVHVFHRGYHWERAKPLH